MRAVAAKPPRPIVSLKNVRVRFRAGEGSVLALDRTSMAVDQGDFVALVGPSGCGKSTILKLIAGLTPPSEGKCSSGGARSAPNGSASAWRFKTPLCCRG
jgi:NitT/TauT family transport system ATP-binding protein